MWGRRPANSPDGGRRRGLPPSARAPVCPGYFALPRAWWQTGTCRRGQATSPQGRRGRAARPAGDRLVPRGPAVATRSGPARVVSHTAAAASPEAEHAGAGARRRDAREAVDGRRGERARRAGRSGHAPERRCLANATPAALAVDGRDDTAWVGTEAGPWEYRVVFRSPVHVSLLRAPSARDRRAACPSPSAGRRRRGARSDLPGDAARRVVLPDLRRSRRSRRWGRRRSSAHDESSWFVDVDACALRLVIDATNGGAPVLRELSAIDGARDVLRDATVVSPRAGSTAGGPDTRASGEGAIDGATSNRSSAPPAREVVDRGEAAEAATARPRAARPRRRCDEQQARARRDDEARPAGRTYGIARGPLLYRLETSVDGVTFDTVATEPHAPGYGSSPSAVVPLRRRLVTFSAREVAPCGW